jgi:transposase
VTCPQGQHSESWQASKDAKGESVVQIVFPKEVCQECPVRERCTTARSTGRSMTVRSPQERHEMLQQARQRQQTAEFQTTYCRRTGVEGTFAQTTRNTGLRRSRYVGMRKTHLQHVLAAVATNVIRLVEWLREDPFAKTRVSRFAVLAA